MKAIIIGITAAIGLLGGAVSMVGNDKTEESVRAGYTDIHAEPVQYLEFTEPMEITGRVQHITFTVDEADEVWGNVNK
jgi:hypothetical protein